MDFGAPWYTHANKASVWCSTSFGDVRIADCASKVLTVQSQRVNARLISQAPQMIDMLRSAYHHLPIEQQEEIQGLINYVYAQTDTGPAKP